MYLSIHEIEEMEKSIDEDFMTDEVAENIDDEYMEMKAVE